MDRVEDKPVKIDVDSVLRQRAQGVRRFMPRVFVKWIEKIICQDDLNYLLAHNHGKRDAEFCEGVLADLNVSLELRGCLPPKEDKRVILVSNHPLGALDGIALIDVLTRHYNCHINFIVNDLLMAVEPLSGVFVPVNKHGRQSRTAKNAVDEAMDRNEPVVIFPAGLCSRRGPGGVIRDLEWKKMFVAKARKYGRDIIPVHFDGRNSSFFYKFAQWRKRLGFKFNIEMVLLPREIFRCRGRHFVISFGKPIPVTSLTGNMAEEAAAIRETVYSLAADSHS